MAKPRNKPNPHKLPVGPRIEFECTECGRRIIRCDSLPEPRVFLLCAECIFYPGWFRDEKLAFILDPWSCRNPPPHELEREEEEPGSGTIM